ncbi:MarR family winged helix-turn-helix transcriptional regulator [Nocardia arizonensis]|uniref:MarR family winged helix-turn-helix transcriptional regulator n=1 Tax=Nocardia arizonensis TaxID=1141647 RepID=UPI0006D24AC2|nr:MarR family winged helix-turn-helix transcriptional regulator [Nocardia arizonensis]
MDDSTAPAALADLARLLRSASQELDRAIANRLGENTTGRWHVLGAVAGGEGRSMSQLSAATLLTGASLTRLIDAMIADNLVHRRGDDTDRRRVLVFPTTRGLHAHRAMAAALDGSGLDELVTDPLLNRLTRLIEEVHATGRAHA